MKIVGGILLINQGTIKLNNKLFEVVNISNLYVDKNYRGSISFEFIIQINKFLERFIVTDYTPSEKTIKILKKFKFLVADSFSYRLTIFKIFEFRNFLNQTEDAFLNYGNFNEKNFENVCNNVNTFKFVINNKILVIYYSKSFTLVDLVFCKLRLRKIRILSISDSNLLRKQYLKIIFKLMFKNFSPIIYFDCLNNKIIKKSLSIKSIKNHLIKVKGHWTNKIDPIGSEISINH